MSWIELTPEHVKARIAVEELNTIEHTGGGDGDRLRGIIEQVTSLVRAKVAGCDRNVLGDIGTIPVETLHAAATLAKHDLRSTLPSTGSEDEGDLRKEEYRQANTFLNQISRCEVLITSDGVQINGQNQGCYGGEKPRRF